MSMDTNPDTRVLFRKRATERTASQCARCGVVSCRDTVVVGVYRNGEVVDRVYLVSAVCSAHSSDTLFTDACPLAENLCQQNPIACKAHR